MTKRKRSLSDVDGDGVPNIKDCDMHDKDKQDYNPNVITATRTFNPKKKSPLYLYKGIPVEKYVFTTEGYVVSPSVKKRAKKRRPKWNKKPKWVKGI